VIVVSRYDQVPGVADDVRAPKTTALHILVLEPECIVEEHHFGGVRRPVMSRSLESQPIIVGDGFEYALEPNGPDLVVGAVNQ
jgi:hypothetical protein